MHYSNSQGLSYIIMVIYTGIFIFSYWGKEIWEGGG